MNVFRRVLVPVDGSAGSERAIARAVAIAAEQKAEIQFVHVIARLGSHQAYDESEHAAHAAGERMLDRAVDRAREHDLLGSSIVLATDDKRRTVAQQILWAAGLMAADLIVCGSHGAGRRLAAQRGSVAEELVSAGKLPLMLEHEESVAQA